MCTVNCPHNHEHKSFDTLTATDYIVYVILLPHVSSISKQVKYQYSRLDRLCPDFKIVELVPSRWHIPRLSEAQPVFIPWSC